MNTHPLAACSIALLLTSAAVVASENGGSKTITVTIEGIKSNDGTIGCALFDRPEGYPSGDVAQAQQQVAPNENSVTCTFSGLAPGRYAVSVSHDVNGNGKMDTRAFGIPKEPWGVSNNVRPRMRAPRFEEAAFELGEEDLEINIRLR